MSKIPGKKVTKSRHGGSVDKRNSQGVKAGESSETSKRTSLSEYANQWKARMKLKYKENGMGKAANARILDTIAKLLVERFENLEVDVNVAKRAEKDISAPKSLKLYSFFRMKPDDRVDEKPDEEMPETKRDPLKITGNESFGEISQILWGENVAIFKEMANELTFSEFIKKMAQRNLGTIAMLVLRDAFNLYWLMYCDKSSDFIVPVVATYVTKSTLRSVDVQRAARISTDLQSLILECLLVVSRLGCYGEDTSDMAAPVVESCAKLAYSVAIELANKGKPLSDTLPILKKYGMSDNKTIVKIIKSLCYILYKLMTADIATVGKDQLIFDLLSEVARFKFE